MKLYQTLSGATRNGYVLIGHPEVIIIPSNTCTPKVLRGAYSAAMAASHRSYDALLIHRGLASNPIPLNQIIERESASDVATTDQTKPVQNWTEDPRLRTFRTLDLEIHVIQALKRSPELH